MATKRLKSTSSKKSPTQYPSPFTKAPAVLDPFLPQLNPAQVYITHIDRHKPDHKRLIFTFAVLVNTTIGILLVWRLAVAVPKYWALIQTVLGYVTSESVDESSTTRQEQVWILAKRVGMMGMDYFLVQFVLPWPMSFFLERPSNPVQWRASVAFQSQEVVVRASRGWGAEELLKGSRIADKSPFWKTRVVPATTMEFLQKTGYLMMDGSWDLDFGAMVDAHTLVSRGEMKWSDIDRVVLVYHEGSGWLSYRFGTEGDVVEENRKKMMAFRDLLQGMGKESLFWKWQGIVEEERPADGDFTAEAQARIAERVGEVFEKEGVDFREAMDSVGEVNALPVVPP